MNFIFCKLKKPQKIFIGGALFRDSGKCERNWLERAVPDWGNKRKGVIISVDDVCLAKLSTNAMCGSI